MQKEFLKHKPATGPAFGRTEIVPGAVAHLGGPMTKWLRPVHSHGALSALWIWSPHVAHRGGVATGSGPRA
jgi:hypothetical protein